MHNVDFSAFLQIKVIMMFGLSGLSDLDAASLEEMPLEKRRT